MFNEKTYIDGEIAKLLTKIQQTNNSAATTDIEFDHFTLECLYIFNKEDRFNCHLEETHMVLPRELLLAKGSFKHSNTYVAASAPFAPFPAYKDINEISLRNWMEIIISQCVADGLFNRSEEWLDSQVQGEYVLVFFKKLKLSMPPNQLMNVLQMMADEKQVNMEKRKPYKI